MTYARIRGLHQIPTIIHNEEFVIHTYFVTILHFMSLAIMFNLVFYEHPFK